MTLQICFQQSSWYYTIHSSFYLHNAIFHEFSSMFFLLFFSQPLIQMIDNFFLAFASDLEIPWMLLCTEVFYSKARHYLFSVSVVYWISFSCFMNLSFPRFLILVSQHNPRTERNSRKTHSRVLLQNENMSETMNKWIHY